MILGSDRELTDLEIKRILSKISNKRLEEILQSVIEKIDSDENLYVDTVEFLKIQNYLEQELIERKEQEK